MLHVLEHLIFLREHIPLKQGLRLRVQSYEHAVLQPLREHIPLKQGLRQL